MTDSKRGDIATRFQKGNQFWKARSTHGRNPIYNDPKKLQEAIEQYFDWVESNPLFEDKPMNAGGIIQHESITKPIPMTITSCARFCGISFDAWQDYKIKPDFSNIINEAESVIRDHKLIGATVGFFNANIIARELGLKESLDANVGGQAGNPLLTDNTFKIEFVNAETSDK